MKRLNALFRLEPDDLIAAACRRTGLDDFGEEGIEEPLRVLTESLKAEANLSLFGRIVAQRDTLRIIETRLRLEHEWSRYPQTMTRSIRAPVFVTGLPRSGTTLLHNLLSLDPVNRAPLSWEVMYPLPAPERSTQASDPRIRRAERDFRWLDRFAPEFRKVHEVDARLPQECIAILSYTFRSSQFHTTYRVPGYQAWLNRDTGGVAYRFHRRFLQHLQWPSPTERWVLKAPSHMFAMDAIFQTYPDARIVQIHRNPAEVMGSVASLTAILQRAFGTGVDPYEAGEEVLQRWGFGVSRVLRYRAQREAQTEQFIDVHYDDLVQDPVDTMATLYSELGWDFTDPHARRVLEYLCARPQARQGVHRYGLREFGLDSARVCERFREYCVRFDVRCGAETTKGV